MAQAAVMLAERELGNSRRDVSDQKCGYDIESVNLQTGQLRFIEVKGRIEGTTTVTVRKNEVLAALNQPEKFILALVQVPTDESFPEGDAFAVRDIGGSYQIPGQGAVVRYVREPFQREPDFGASSVNYEWKELWEKGDKPLPMKAIQMESMYECP